MLRYSLQGRTLFISTTTFGVGDLNERGAVILQKNSTLQLSQGEFGETFEFSGVASFSNLDGDALLLGSGNFTVLMNCLVLILTIIIGTKRHNTSIYIHCLHHCPERHFCYLLRQRPSERLRSGWSAGILRRSTAQYRDTNVSRYHHSGLCVTWIWLWLHWIGFLSAFREPTRSKKSITIGC